MGKLNPILSVIFTLRVSEEIYICHLPYSLRKSAQHSHRKSFGAAPSAVGTENYIVGTLRIQNVWRKEMIIRHCAAPSSVAAGWKEKKTAALAT